MFAFSPHGKPIVSTLEMKTKYVDCVEVAGALRQGSNYTLGTTMITRELLDGIDAFTLSEGLP